MKTIYYKNLDKDLLLKLYENFNEEYKNLSNEQKLEVYQFMKASAQKYMSVSKDAINKIDEFIKNNTIKLYEFAFKGAEREKKLASLKKYFDTAKVEQQKENLEYFSQYDFSKRQDIFRLIYNMESDIAGVSMRTNALNTEGLFEEKVIPVEESYKQGNETEIVFQNDGIIFSSFIGTKVVLASFKVISKSYVKQAQAYEANNANLKICLDNLDKMFPEIKDDNEELDYNCSL